MKVKISISVMIVVLILCVFTMPVYAVHYDYVIVAPWVWHDDLANFIAFKEAQGFSIKLVGSYNKTAEQIRDIVQGYTPSYLLLVGDVNNGNPTVPSFYGTYQEEEFVTDFFYKVDGETVLDIQIGRIPARTLNELMAYINHLISYSASIDDVFLLVGYDAPQYVIDTNNYIFNTPAEGDGELWTFPDISAGNVIDELNENPKWAVTYSGHGSTLGWSNSITTYYLPEINYTDTIIFSFACDTADFEYYQSFGEQWITQNKALAFIGSSVETGWSGDDYLNKGMMTSFYAGEHTLGDILEDGLQYLNDEYSEYLYLQYREKYQLFGDPSMEILTLDCQQIGD